MRRRIGKRRRTLREAPELDITTFLNLMVVLVPFLLISAVFSRVTILELSVPTNGDGSGSSKPAYTVEVVVRKNGLELSNGIQVVAALPFKDDHYDLETLSEMLTRLKTDYPDKTDATVLMEPDIEYDTLIQVMDTLREKEILVADAAEPQKLELFPVISIGDAP
jgi:biopolymer transport protein ExbD